MRPSGRKLSRSEVLAWNDPWDYTDRARIAAALDAIPHGVYVQPPSGGVIGVWINGHRALVIHPGWMEWPDGRWSKGLPMAHFPDLRKDEQDLLWHLLSTFQPHSRGPTSGEQPATVFPRCFTELPLTGVCNYCA
jgi:hypothetical protein